MDVPLLLSWLSARQYAPEGGYSGRTNKLVDGCYSHWVGDCWPLIQSALRGATDSAPSLDSNLYNREGLARYILNCCQNKIGGLRDKPGKYVVFIIWLQNWTDVGQTDSQTHIIPATH